MTCKRANSTPGIIASWQLRERQVLNTKQANQPLQRATWLVLHSHAERFADAGGVRKGNRHALPGSHLHAQAHSGQPMRPPMASAPRGERKPLAITPRTQAGAAGAEAARSFQAAPDAWRNAA